MNIIKMSAIICLVPPDNAHALQHQTDCSELRDERASKLEKNMAEYTNFPIASVSHPAKM